MKNFGAVGKLSEWELVVIKMKWVLFLNQQGYLNKVVDKFRVRGARFTSLPVDGEIQLSRS